MPAPDQTTGNEDTGSDDTPPAAPAATDIMSKLTDNDPSKLQALLGQLKDQQTRGKWAEALAVIGDTLGNVGQAKAGMAPSGFTSTNLVQGMNKQNQADLTTNVQAELANDPNSQTSKWAQNALATAMNLQPGAPKLAVLSKTPAAVILQQMPQLSEAFKLQVQREANTLQQNQSNASTKLGYAQLAENAKDRAASNDVAKMNAQVTEAKDKGELNANLAKDTSIFNPLHYAAQNNVAKVAGAAPQPAAHPQDAAAVNWAHTHPTDPRAAQILKANGF